MIANYSFDASAGEVTFTDINPIRLDRVLLVVNATYNNTILYNFASNIGGAVGTNVLYLAYDCSLMSDTDKLLIFYDDGVDNGTISGTVTANLSATDNAVLDNIQTAVDAINAKMVTGTDIGDVTINNASLAVTGTFWQATQPVSLASVPSHDVTNAGTFAVQAELSATDNAVLDDIAANQTDASQKTQIVDGSGNVIGATSNALDVNIKSGASAGEQYTDGTAVNASYKATLVAGTDGSNYQILGTDADGHMQVDVLSAPSTAVTNADITSCKTALELLDDSVDGNYLNVNLNVAGTDVAANNGTASAQTLRVTVASDSTGQIIANGNLAHDAADSGNPVKIGGKAVSGVPAIVSNGDRVNAYFDPNGRLVTVRKCSTGTANTVAASATAVTIIAANNSRVGATIYNDSTVALYLLLSADTSVSTSNFTVKLQADDYYEVPFGYYGKIEGLWASATGNARTMEFTL